MEKHPITSIRIFVACIAACPRSSLNSYAIWEFIATLCHHKSFRQLSPVTSHPHQERSQISLMLLIAGSGMVGSGGKI